MQVNKGFLHIILLFFYKSHKNEIISVNKIAIIDNQKAMIE